MEIFVDGTVANYWNGTWLPLVGFAIAVVATLLVVWRSPLTAAGFAARGLVIVALVSTSPLAFYRAGLRVAVSDFESVIFLSIVGSSTAALLGLTALFTKARPFTLAGRQVGLNTFVGAVSGPGNEKPQAADGIDSRSGHDAPATLVNPTPEPLLTVTSGSSSGKTIGLPKLGTISVGRDQDNDIVIDDPSVSRHHAQVSYNNGQVVLLDLDSSNGTLVDGERINKKVLRTESTIKIGTSNLKLRSEGRFEPAAPRPAQSATPQAGNPAETVVRSRQPSAVAWLTVQSGAERGQSFALGSRSYSAGRDHGNDIALSDPSVSREHAFLRYCGDGYVLNDAGSSGGTAVNGKRVGGQAWPAGKSLRIGETTMQLASYQGTDSTPPSEDRTFVGSPRRPGVMVIVQEGPDAGSTFHLRDGNNTIGRDSDCGVPLADETVSRQHCVARVENGVVTVFDLGSASGVSVNGNIVPSGVKLQSGDSVTLGNVAMAFVAVALGGQVAGLRQGYGAIDDLTA